MFCTECGTKNPENSANCYSCGRKMVNASGRAPQIKVDSLQEVKETPSADRQPSLDPRKNPWKRGDLCTRGLKNRGFVLSHAPEYLEVRWMGDEGVERIPAENIDDLLRAAHADSLAPGGRTYLETLESLEGLRFISEGIKERMKTVKTKAEEEELNRLVRRIATVDECAWDKQNYTNLIGMLIQPEEVGFVFKLRDRIHQPFCKRRE